MIQIERLVCTPMFQENCYLVYDETNEAVIIDCGAYDEREQSALVNRVRELNLQVKHLLATHGHLDHNFGNRAVKEAFGVGPTLHENDDTLYHQISAQAENILGVGLELELPEPEKLITANDKIRFGNTELQVIETPGHTEGSVLFYCPDENVVFSGDTLFRGSVGRTDLIGGSMFHLIQSLRAVSQLPEQTVVYPGHGEKTTIGYELATNPYMGE